MNIKTTIIKFIIISVISVTGFACAKQAGDLYVSETSGTENAKGTVGDPCNSISRAVSLASEGDVIYVAEGVYREKLEITKPGISILAENNRVSITGTDFVEIFEDAGNGLYKAYQSKKVTQLFVDGVPQVRAKYPNQEIDTNLFNFTTINIKFSGDTIISDDIPDIDGYFKGASIWMIVWKRWVGGTAKIKEHKGNMLLLSDISLPYEGEGIAFISNSMNCLDNDGEWYWANDTLYYKNTAIDILKCKVEAKTRETLIELDGAKDVKIEGISGYAGNILFRNTEGCKISKGNFKWMNDYDYIDAESAYSRGKKASLSTYGLGVAMFGNRDTLSCCEFSWAAGDCVSLYGSHNVLLDCKVHDANYRGTDAAPVSLGGLGNKILYCEIFNGGRDVISAPSAQAFKVMHNSIHHTGLVAWDVGLLYTYDTDGKDAEIAYNIVHDAHSGNPETWWGASGIYLDNNSRNFLVHHNVSYNAKGLGIQVNDPGRNIRVYNNTVYNTHYDMTPYNNGHFPKIKGANCKFYNNYVDRPIKKTGWIEEKGNVYTAEDLLQDRENWNYVPEKESVLIDAGVVVGELKDISFKGKAPDVGAYEFGMPVWKVGPRCNFDKK